MDNALPLPSGIVDGQQEVLHTNMYVPFFFFFPFYDFVHCGRWPSLSRRPALPTWCAQAHF